MKIKLKLFGGSREFSEKEYLELQVQKKALVKDLRNEIIRYLKKITIYSHST